MKNPFDEPRRRPHKNRSYLMIILACVGIVIIAAIVNVAFGAILDMYRKPSDEKITENSRNTSMPEFTFAETERKEFWNGLTFEETKNFIGSMINVKGYVYENLIIDENFEVIGFHIRTTGVTAANFLLAYSTEDPKTLGAWTQLQNAIKDDLIPYIRDWASLINEDCGVIVTLISDEDPYTMLLFVLNDRVVYDITINGDEK